MRETNEPIAPFGFRTAGDIRFGRGTAEACLTDVASLGRKILLVRGGSVAFADVAAETFSAHGVEVVTLRARGEPVLEALEAACGTARTSGVAAVMAIGGGSVIDLGKAVAALAPGQGRALDHLEGVGKGHPLQAHPLPFIAVPSTAGTGAEVTRNAVISVPEAGRKVSLRDDRMLPDIAVIDPGLTDNSPREVTFASGLDAVTQVIEPYISARANPLTDAICAHAIPKGLRALAKLADRECPRARDDLAFVSFSGGMALANAGLGAVHGLAGVIGGRTGAPHGLICGRLLGPVLQANAAALRDAGRDTARIAQVAGWIAESFGTGEGLDRWPALLDSLGVAPLSPWLAAPGMLEEIAGEAATASSMRANPIDLPKDILVRIMRAS